MKIFSMGNRTIIYSMGVVAAMALTFQSCKPKINEIDNNQVISKPYSLYVGDSSGTILNTNEGFNYKYVVFNGGIPTTSIITAGNNILFYQYNLHIIENSLTGNNSNPTYTDVGFGFEQSIMHYWARYKRVYVISALGKGMVYNDDFGEVNKWRPVTDENVPAGTQITSFTELKSGKLIALDNFNKETFRLSDPGQQWQKTTGGTKLPVGLFYLTHKENTVIAVDYSGQSGAFYSTDDGATWNAYAGLPAGDPLYCANAPFDQTVLIGTASKGIYRLKLGETNFEPASIGLTQNMTVRAIVGKEDYYKNGISKRYIYAATSKGIFRSEDFGDNWVIVKEGNFVSAY